MSKNLDRAFDVLSGHDQQRSPEAHQYDDVAPEIREDCWHCERPGDVNDLGLCVDCAAWMADESGAVPDPAPPEFIKSIATGLPDPAAWDLTPWVAEVLARCGPGWPPRFRHRDPDSFLGRALDAVFTDDMVAALALPAARFDFDPIEVNYTYVPPVDPVAEQAREIAADVLRRLGEHLLYGESREVVLHVHEVGWNGEARSHYEEGQRPILVRVEEDERGGFSFDAPAGTLPGHGRGGEGAPEPPAAAGRDHGTPPESRDAPPRGPHDRGDPR